MEETVMTDSSVYPSEIHMNQGTDQDDKGEDSGLNAKQNAANVNIVGSAAGGSRYMHNKMNGKQSFASLFKDNRALVEASLLKYTEPPIGELVIGCEEIETVEKTFGYCLVGYVTGSRPNAYTILNFVKRWGGNVKFLFKENGWIKFQFGNELQRDAVLDGGPYLIAGRQLFLRKMPSCFLFSKDDIVFLPLWVQIYELLNLLVTTFPSILHPTQFRDMAE